MRAEIFYHDMGAVRNIEYLYLMIHSAIGQRRVSADAFARFWKKVASLEVKDSSVESLELLFARFNDDRNNPLATVAGQSKIRSLGVGHTSMSVGDVVRVDGKYFMVVDDGFDSLVVYR